MCTGVAKKFLGKGVVGVYGDMTNSRKERGAGMCHSLVTAQGGDMWLQQQLVPLLVTRQELCTEKSLCQGGLPHSAQGPSPGRAEDAWKFPQRAIKE